MVARALLVVLVAGCNQIFGLHDTRLVDAASPIQFVQVNDGDSPFASVSSVDFLSPVTAHDAIVACVYVQGTTLSDFHDSQGNTYTTQLGPVAMPGTSAGNLYVRVALDAAGGPDTISVTTAGTSDTILVFVHEYANVGGIDATASAMGSGLAMGTDGVATAPTATQASGDLIFGFVMTGGNAQPGTDFLARSTRQQNVTEDRAVGAAGPYAATATMQSGDGWAVVMAALKAR